MRYRPAVAEEAGAPLQGDLPSGLQLRRLADMAPDMMGVAEWAPGEQDVRYVWANRATALWYRVPPEQIPGSRAVADLGADRALVDQVIEAFDRCWKTQAEVHFRLVLGDHPRGPEAVRSLEVRVAPEDSAPGGRPPGGRPRFAFVTSHELGHLAAERELRVSEERMRLAARAADLGTYDYDARTQEAYWSEELAQMFGRPGKSKATAEEIMQVLHPEDREKFLGMVQRVMDPDGPRRFEHEYRIVRPSGEVRYVRDQGVSLFSNEASGEARRVVGVFQDVTERKRAERQVIEDNRRKDEFLAMLAHELRNPLAPLKTGLDVLQMETELPDSTEPILGIMERQLNLLVRLVDDLLDVSRITRGKPNLDMEVVEARGFVRSAVEAAESWMAHAELKFGQDLQDLDTILRADTSRLTQVLSNLLSNAAKYNRPGGSVFLSTRAADEHFEVVVEDDGVGIDPADQEAIFELFHQVDMGKRSTSGLGIGLTIVRELVDLHGGRVDLLKSHPGRGSSFRIRLPILRVDDSARSGVSSPARPLRLDGISVLVVDDNEAVLSTLSMALAQRGAEVRTARDGAAAVEATRSFRPRAVVMDLGMPVLDGLEAARRIRAFPGGPEVHLIAVTGWGQAQDIQRTTEAGFDAHLTKPPDLDQLTRILVAGPDRRASGWPG